MANAPTNPPGAANPAYDAAAITPSDSTLLAGVVALYVGTTGNVAVRTQGGATVTFSSVPAGAILPVRCDRVMSTNTTASNIVAFINPGA